MLNRTLKCVILDDEFLAGKLIHSYAVKTEGLDIVLRTTSAAEAAEYLTAHQVDLIFLDVQMPELTGIELMERFSYPQLKVILITAYAEYALQGYEHQVIDYLLKPVTFERFSTAVKRAKERISTQPFNDKSFLFVKTAYRLQRIAFDDILYIEGLRDYFAIYTRNGKILSLERMKNLLQELPEKDFLRIHKSYIINVNQVDYIERGRIVVNKEYLPIGDTYKQQVMERLGL